MTKNLADRGVTLIETMIAILVAFVVMSSLGAVVFTATPNPLASIVSMFTVASVAEFKI